MVDSGLQPTRENLFTFLDFVAEKGLMKRQTAMAYKKACNVILKILDAKEVNDLSKINLEDVFRRHQNIAAGKIIPATLKSYEARTRAAIDGFIEYIKDPTSWKPSVQQRTRTIKATTGIKETPTNLAQDKKSEGVKVIDETPTQSTIHIDLQIHISPEVTPAQIDQIFASMRRHLYTK